MINIARTFLDAYEICLKAAPPDWCRTNVVDNSGVAIDVYLKSYETCRSTLGADYCKSVFAPDPTSKLNLIPVLAIGFFIGALVVRK